MSELESLRRETLLIVYLNSLCRIGRYRLWTISELVVYGFAWALPHHFLTLVFLLNRASAARGLL